MNTQPVLIRDGDIYSGYNFIGENIPIGAILPLMGLTAPTGYLICDGTTHLIEDYPDLTEFFKTQFGSSNFFGGDGVTTFKVPDLRGEFLRGTGTNGHSGEGSGANVGVHQDATEMPEIGIWKAKNAFIPFDATEDIVIKNKDTTKGNYQINYTAFNNTIGVVSSQGIYTSRPTNTSVTYIIKAFVSPATGDSGESKTPIRYSTEEQWTGKYWLDGKKIYCRVIQDTAPNVETGLKLVGGNYNVDTVISYEAYIDFGTGWAKANGTMDAAGRTIMIGITSDNGYLQPYLRYFNAPSGWFNAPCNVYFEYTKTTD